MISYKKSRSILKISKISIGNEIVDVNNCLNRVTSSNIFSTSNNPSANNAAFDGFAVSSKDTKNLSKKKSRLFRILGLIVAGNKPYKKKIFSNWNNEVNIPRVYTTFIEKSYLSHDKTKIFFLTQKEIWPC